MPRSCLLVSGSQFGVMKHVQKMWRFVFSSRRSLALGGVAVIVAFLAGCQGAQIDSRPYEKHSDGTWRRGEEQRDTIFGKGGITLFGGKSRSHSSDGGKSGIGINAFLWRASLDTMSFMPLASADPFGGVIITDWYTPPETPEERFKVNLYILGRTLRSDAVKATVFRQKRTASKHWTDVTTTASVTRDLEDTILTRARELRHVADKEQ